MQLSLKTSLCWWKIIFQMTRAWDRTRLKVLPLFYVNKSFLTKLLPKSQKCESTTGEAGRSQNGALMDGRLSYLSKVRSSRRSNCRCDNLQSCIDRHIHQNFSAECKLVRCHSPPIGLVHPLGNKNHAATTVSSLTNEIGKARPYASKKWRYSIQVHPH